MAAGSSLAAVKAAIQDVLVARNGLSGVPVTLAGPASAEDLQNDTGAFEAIWLGDATAPDIEPPHLGTPVTLDETYDVDVVIQVLKIRESDSSQEAADTRAAALLGEVIGALAADPSLGIATSSTLPMSVEALPTSWTHKGGWFQRGGQHGSRFVLKVRVEARLQLT